MVVIFGWGAGEAKDLGEIAPTTCPNCRNQVFLHHIQTKKQVSLYFIPMASYGGTEYLSCPICRHGIQLAAGASGGAQEHALMPPPLYRKGGLAEAAYRASVERFWAALGMAPSGQQVLKPAATIPPGDPRVDPVAGHPARRSGQAACRRRAHR